MITHAPLVVKDKVIVGVGGGEGPTRGFIVALDANTGNEVWRFHLCPQRVSRGTRLGQVILGEQVVPACGTLAHTTPS